MNKIAMYAKNITLATTLIVLTTANSYIHAKNSTTVIKNLGNFIIKIEDILTQFFNDKDKTPYSEFVLHLGKTISDFEHKLEHVTRTPDDSYITDACEIAQYGRQQFNAAYGIIKQYKGKPADQVVKFVQDLQKVFSPDTAFTTLVKKLTALQKKAEETQDENLTHIIQQLIHVIEKKKDKWTPSLSMLSKLRFRMNCK